MHLPLDDPPRERGQFDDDDLLVGFAPNCPACSLTMRPHSSRDGLVWWRCGECALPRIC